MVRRKRERCCQPGVLRVRDGMFCEWTEYVWMVQYACTRKNQEYSLSIFNMFRNNGPGSLSLTTTWNSRNCMMSYTSIRCSGISPRASSCRIVTFPGSHRWCGQSAISMSKPSSWAVGGRVRARSRSQILQRREVVRMAGEFGRRISFLRVEW